MKVQVGLATSQNIGSIIASQEILLLLTGQEWARSTIFGPKQNGQIYDFLIPIIW